MWFGLKNLLEHSLQLITIAPKLIPEVLQQPLVRNPIAVSLGAIAGALSRYYLSLWFAQRFGLGFPYGTFFINISGCLAMGFFFTFSVEKIAIISPEIRLLIAVGFLGAYTTFSTYALDTVSLLNNQNFITANVYLFGSAILGIISLQIGMILARFLP
ncbi:fluoride efflux transporter CrcB [Nostoc sp. CMAA1605]|uniref:fluoride efflux transporter CrcB n=1 Tax=Nostoc sp. CMAA1605 TaxID=2055159 RepID=UPI001F307F3C|nr:fluoride efflux transporter CrcB [Nostoc sp. CMAA1605]MCF4970537.1 fluoride efflux transporter CrcB [Nostoc sp. CMAA1605]